MDALAPSTIVVAMEQLDQELAVLTERRQLLQQLLATFDDDNGDTVEPPAPKLAAVPPAAKPAPRLAKPAKATPKGTLRKWDWQEVAQVIDDALAAGKNPRLVLIQRYEVNDAMSYYLLKQVKKHRTPVNLPKPPVDTGRFTTDDAMAAIEGAAAG